MNRRTGTVVAMALLVTGCTPSPEAIMKDPEKLAGALVKCALAEKEQSDPEKRPAICKGLEEALRKCGEMSMADLQADETCGAAYKTLNVLATL